MINSSFAGIVWTYRIQYARVGHVSAAARKTSQPFIGGWGLKCLLSSLHRAAKRRRGTWEEAFDRKVEFWFSTSPWSMTIWYSLPRRSWPENFCCLQLLWAVCNFCWASSPKGVFLVLCTSWAQSRGALSGGRSHGSKTGTSQCLGKRGSHGIMFLQVLWTCGQMSMLQGQQK